MYSNHCLELTRRNLTKKRAGLLMIFFSYLKLRGNRLFIIDKTHHEHPSFVLLHVIVQFTSLFLLDADFVEISSKKFMVPIQRSWITSTVP